MALFGRPNIEKMMTKKDVRGLINTLSYTDTEVRKSAINALGEIGDLRAFDPLLNRIRDGRDEERNIVVEAMVKIGSQAVDSLIEVLSNERFSKEDKFVYLAAIEALVGIGDKKAVASLLALNIVGYWGIGKALKRIGDPAIEQAIALLDNEDSTVIQGAAKWLGEIRDVRAVEPLITLLGNEDNFVRIHAIEALCDICDARIVEPLIALLNDRNISSGVITRAVQALGVIGDARAVEPLIALLGNKDIDVCNNAAKWLGVLGDDRAVGPLIALLRNEDESTREEAAEALYEIGEPAKGPLIIAFKDDGWDEFSIFAKVLIKLKVPFPDAKAINPEDEKAAISILNSLCSAYATSNKAEQSNLEPQAKNIGEDANDRGGIIEMRRMFHKLKKSTGKRNLEFFWSGIGIWRG